MPETVESGSIADFALAKVFEQLSETQATGLLEVRSQRGRKLITLEKGKAAIASEGEFRREYLGELLVARKKITRPDLERALETQKFHNAPLGETLAEMGLVSRGDIEQVLRLQIEDELCDLFSWREGVYEFKPQAQLPPELDGSAVRISVDPRTLLTEAAKRVRVWPELEKSIPSPLAVFKLIDRGQTLYDTASMGAKRFLVLVDQGHPVKEIVRRSYIGRFSVYKTLADLIKTKHIAERTGEEMEILARDRIRENDHEHARLIFQRLLECADAPTDRERYKEQLVYINELEQRSRVIEKPAAATVSATERGVRTDAVTLARRAPARFWLGRALVLALVVVGLVAVGAVLAVAVSPPLRARFFDTGSEELPELKAQVSKAVQEGDYNAAMSLLWDFLARHPGSASNKDVAAELKRVSDLVENEIDKALEKVEALQKAGRLKQALDLLDQAMKNLPPGVSGRVRMDRTHASLDRDYREEMVEEARAKVRERLSTAEEQLNSGRPEDAKATASAILEIKGLPTEVESGANSLLAGVEDVLSRQEDLFSAALRAKETGEYDEAERRFNELMALARHSGYALRADQELKTIASRRKKLDEDLDQASRLLAAGDPRKALEVYQDVARHDGFYQATTARRRAMEIETSFEESKRLLKSYESALGDGRHTRAQDMLERLSLRYGGYVKLDGLKRPLNVVSVPAGAQVILDGIEVGATPMTVLVSVGRRTLVRVEKDGFRHYEEVVQDTLRRRVSAYLTPKAKRVFAWDVQKTERVFPLEGALFLATGSAGTFIVGLEGAPPVRAHPGRVAVRAGCEEGLVLADEADVFHRVGTETRKVATHGVGAPIAMFVERMPAYRNRAIVGLAGTDGAALIRLVDGRRLARAAMKDIKGVALLPHVIVLSDGNELTSLDRGGLRKRWSKPWAKKIVGGPVATSTGAVACLDSDGTLFEVNAGTGSPTRRKLIAGMRRGTGTLAVLGSEIIFLRQEFVYRLDWETGLIWERTLDRKTIEGLLHTTPQAIYMAGKDAFFMLAVTDGTVETKTGWSGRIIGLENTQEGILLFATDDRVLSGYLLKEGGE